ncbi:TetR family transcriptional regulator [Nocardioides insulae]|uniref:TetR family transcriptional regulator n=1 Tax=Nocardioides insulae TaxID=394734 RepID=UPI0003F9F100|nr:TetR family transcriptional regulator [Nocardioides insulae]
MTDQIVTRRTPEARAFRAERVIEVATELATEGGYDGVQMREVARRAPVALATLYRYYPSKDELLRAAIGAQLEALESDITRRPPRQHSASGRAAEAFIRAFHAMGRSRGFAHAAMSSFQTPRPLQLDPEGEPRPKSTRFSEIATLAAWGVDHHPTSDQRKALAVLESLWVSSVIDWLNGQLTASYVDSQLRFAADRLLDES